MSEIYRRILKCCRIVFLEPQFNVENICLPLSALWIIWLFEKSHFTPSSIAWLGSACFWYLSAKRKKKQGKKREKKKRDKEESYFMHSSTYFFLLGMGVTRTWHILRQSSPKHSCQYSRPNVTEIIIDSN